MLRLSLILCLFVTTPLRADPLRIVTDIAPIADLVAAVAGQGAEVTALVPAGGDPHHVHLRPSEARAVAQADIIVWVGPALTPWMGDILSDLAPETPRLTLMDLAQTRLLPAREAEDHDAHADHDDHGHDDHADHDGHDTHDDHGHDDHAHGPNDPHVWLDPQNARAWMPVIAALLAEITPDQAQTYSANAADADAKLIVLTEALSSRLTPVATQPFAVAHDALHYFEDRFALRMVGALSESDADAPGLAAVATLRRQLADTGATCLIVDSTANPRVMQQIANDSTPPRRLAQVALSTGAEPPALPGYVALMTILADTLVDCLTPQN